MKEEYGEAVEQELNVLETKVERIYDIHIQSELDKTKSALEYMSKEISETIIQYIDGSEYDEVIEVVTTLTNQASSLLEQLIETVRKQEKQEAMYKTSHLYSHSLDVIVTKARQEGDMCLAEARNCVSMIQDIFKLVKQLFEEELPEILQQKAQIILDKIKQPIYKCSVLVDEIHSQHTYNIENKICVSLTKMANNLVKEKEKNVKEDKRIRIKGGVTNFQNSNVSLSDILSSKVEIEYDIPKRDNIQGLFD